MQRRYTRLLNSMLSLFYYPGVEKGNKGNTIYS
jgi:hypothetical protein